MYRLVQLTLDLFDLPGAPAPAAPAVPAPADIGTQVASGPPRAPASTPAAPPQPLADAIAPARFVHPRANRQARFGHAIVAYELVRARRRTIGFSVGAEGLTVSAPRWVPLHEIESALQKKGNWVLRKLAEFREREARAEAGRIDWKDGATVPFLGEPVIVVLDPRHASTGGAVLNTDGQALPGVARLALHIGLPHHAGPAQIRDAVQAWLVRQAERVFTERLAHFAPSLGVQWRRLVLSNAATRWGSAHADGTIRLNWRLVHMRREVIDYVVAHELSHLRVMDHSPRFWDTVATVVPDYLALRRQLRGDPLPPWQ